MATITDNFNRADAGSLGSSSEGWSWADTVTGLDIVSNQAKGDSSGFNRARAESDLASANHYAQVTMVLSGDGAGPCVRFSSSADTCYLYYCDLASGRIFSVVAGSLTSLGSFGNPGNGSVLKLSANGTTLEAFDDGVSQGTVTDSAISGNTRTGIEGSTSAAVLDDFSAGDLGGGVTAHPENLLLLGVGG